MVLKEGLVIQEVTVDLGWIGNPVNIGFLLFSNHRVSSLGSQVV